MLAAALGVLAGGNKALPPWPLGAGGAAGVWVGRGTTRQGALLAGQLAGPLGWGPALGTVWGPWVSAGNGGLELWLLRTGCFPPSPPGWRQGDVLGDPPGRVGQHRRLRGPWNKEGLSNLTSRCNIPEGERGRRVPGAGEARPLAESGELAELGARVGRSRPEV